MLTREHAIAVYKGGLAFSDRLTTTADRAYLGLAERMCGIYRDGVGLTRRELHRRIERVLEEQADCPPKRMASFCKLLDEVSKFDKDQRGEAAKLRQQVFRAAAPLHPLVSEVDAWFEHEHWAAKQRVASKLGTSWEVIERKLFADIIDFHRLLEFSGYTTASDLLARYNVAQTQAALYDAVQVSVWATRDFKMILRYAKLGRLMHTIHRLDENSYRFDFSGPASLLCGTRRYGVNVAKFLPGLLSCRDWKLEAELRPPQWRGRLVLRLSSRDGLRSQAAEVADFDSDLERDFAEKWGDQPRDGWMLHSEADIMHEGQKVFVPDFTLVHNSGQRVLLELVGYWTPEYIEHKLRTLLVFAEQPILLAIAESSAADFQHVEAESAARIVTFKRRLAIASVLAQLNDMWTKR